jgi:hypothetical protein
MASAVTSNAVATKVVIQALESADKQRSLTFESLIGPDMFKTTKVILAEKELIRCDPVHITTCIFSLKG